LTSPALAAADLLAALVDNTLRCSSKLPPSIDNQHSDRRPPLAFGLPTVYPRYNFFGLFYFQYSQQRGGILEHVPPSLNTGTLPDLCTVPRIFCQTDFGGKGMKWLQRVMMGPWGFDDGPEQPVDVQHQRRCPLHSTQSTPS
jgi:hypothetical protein